MDNVTQGGSADHHTSASAARAGKYLTFALSDEIYGLEILRVQEIIGLQNVTHVPKTPDYIRGVINLRGKVIPVLELRVKFGMPTVPDDDRTCIVVVRVKQNSATVTMGILVDSVSEVLDIPQSHIEDAPEFGAAVQTDFLLGIGKIAQKVILLLDVNRVLSANEFGGLAQVGETV